MSIVFENEKYCDHTFLFFTARNIFQFNFKVHFVAILLVFTVSKSTSLRVFYNGCIREVQSLCKLFTPINGQIVLKSDSRIKIMGKSVCKFFNSNLWLLR